MAQYWALGHKKVGIIFSTLLTLLLMSGIFQRAKQEIGNQTKVGRK